MADISRTSDERNRQRQAPVNEDSRPMDEHNRRRRPRLQDPIPEVNPPLNSNLNLGFSERGCRIARDGLVYPVRSNNRNHAYVVNLAQLQRLNLHYLRKDLAEEVGKIVRTIRMELAQGQTIRRLMSEYCKQTQSSSTFIEELVPSRSTSSCKPGDKKSARAKNCPLTMWLEQVMPFGIGIFWSKSLTVMWRKT